MNQEESDLNSKDITNDFKVPSDIESDFQDNHVDQEDEFQSIFQIESKYHDLKFHNRPKQNSQKNNKICLDPPAIYSFRGLVEIPTQIKKQNINHETFLKARIALEKQLEIIGLADDHPLDNDNALSKTGDLYASKLADQICSLQKYKIRKSQKEYNEVLFLNDTYLQQPDLISPNDINPYKESRLILLDQFQCSFKPNNNSNNDLHATMKEICGHYNDTAFNVDQAFDLLQQIT